MNESQRAMVAAEIADMEHGGDRKSDHTANLQVDPPTRAEAAEKLNVSKRSVNTAKKVQREAIPERPPRCQGGWVSA